MTSLMSRMSGMSMSGIIISNQIFTSFKVQTDFAHNQNHNHVTVHVTVHSKSSVHHIKTSNLS